MFQISAASPGQSNISLIYTDVSQHFISQTAASFVVAQLSGRWARFSLRVTTDNVTLFFNCHEHDTVQVRRTPLELIFDSASTLYVGQAGPLIKGAFDVSTANNATNDRSADTEQSLHCPAPVDLQQIAALFCSRATSYLCLDCHTRCVRAWGVPHPAETPRTH